MAQYTIEQLIDIHNRLLLKQRELQKKEDVNPFIMQVLEEEIIDLKKLIDDYYNCLNNDSKNYIRISDASTSMQIIDSIRNSSNENKLINNIILLYHIF